VTYFLNFGTPSVSRERLKLENSNLASRLITENINEKNEKLGQLQIAVREFLIMSGTFVTFVQLWNKCVN